MTNFIPIFPLSIVVYPGEQVNLHIFEPKYKQLITECFAANKPFGILPVINNKLTDTGTLVKITELSKKYDDGKMDIKTEGLVIFNVIEIIKELPHKLYSGAIVNYPITVETGNKALMLSILSTIKELHKFLNIYKDFKKPDTTLCSYDVAHHAGLSLQQEYELLQLLYELQRQEYLKRHLKKLVPLMAQMETLKKRVQLNGHFKNLDTFNL